MSKLGLDFTKVQKARHLSRNIADDVQTYVEKHTTTSIERAICRFFGIDGIDEDGIPLPNVVVKQITDNNLLNEGICRFLGNAIIETNMDVQEVAEKVSRGKLDIARLKMHPLDEIKIALKPLVDKAVNRVRKNRDKRKEFLNRIGEGPRPYLYVIVATGNIYEDVIQAKAAVEQGADIVAVIRSTAQSLLDYVPYGATSEGYGGTYATQENFRIMREGLDEAGEKAGRYIRLCNYCSGLCMPEIAVMGAFERLDVMLNDALYGILFRDINMKRTLIDQFFSRVINGFAGVIINTGEDNYLTTSDAYEAAHTVLASQFINERLALLAGIPEEQMGLGHAFEMNPSMKNGFLYEVAQAQLSREIFPRAPLKYMPPTRFKTGNIFKGHLQDAMFNVISIMTNQAIQLLGMPTEAIHTPFMGDRYLSIENAQYIFNNMRNISEEISFKAGGIIQKRAQKVLDESISLLEQISEEGLFSALEKGIFADIKRPRDGGKGLNGVAEKSENYFNPFISKMLGGTSR
ncbi:MAG: lysine 5,6-aminomutase subunit alpha [Petrotogales bacterium]